MPTSSIIRVKLRFTLQLKPGQCRRPLKSLQRNETSWLTQEHQFWQAELTMTSPAPRVSIQNVPVCTSNKSTCVSTCACGASIHENVLNVHTKPFKSTHTNFQRATPGLVNLALCFRCQMVHFRAALQRTLKDMLTLVCLIVWSNKFQKLSTAAKEASGVSEQHTKMNRRPTSATRVSMILMLIFLVPSSHSSSNHVPAAFVGQSVFNVSLRNRFLEH